MSNYGDEGETFELDYSDDCYVKVTYAGLTGYFGVNISGTGSDLLPYLFYVGDEEYTTPNGLTNGQECSSFNEARDSLCAELARIIREKEAVKTFDPAKYCKELHDAVKNQP